MTEFRCELTILLDNGVLCDLDHSLVVMSARFTKEPGVDQLVEEVVDVVACIPCVCCELFRSRFTARDECVDDREFALLEHCEIIFTVRL